MSFSAEKYLAQLKPFQRETVEYVFDRYFGADPTDRFLVADEVGLGKTIEAVMVLREYQLRGMARRVLILVPAPLLRQWAGELEAKAGISFRTTEDPQLDADPAANHPPSRVALERAAR